MAAGCDELQLRVFDDERGVLADRPFAMPIDVC